MLFAVNVALIGARNEVVRYLPQTASLFAAIGLPVNLRNLQIRERAGSRKETQDGVSILIVEGTIVSTAKQAGRGAAPALCRAQRHRPGGLHLDRAAEPQHSRRPAKRCDSTAGSPRRRPTPATSWCASSTAQDVAKPALNKRMAQNPDRRGRRRHARTGRARARSRTATS